MGRPRQGRCLSPAVLAAVLFVAHAAAHPAGNADPAGSAQDAEEKALQDKYPDYRGVDPDYHHAGEAALDRWRDRRYGMRIHWGQYSILGLDASWPTYGASPEFKTIYRTLYQVFNPVDFDADAWAQLADGAGFKYFVFTAKHHDGFSMFDTGTRVQALRRKPRGRVPGLGNVEEVEIAYSMMDTPFKRDIVRELVDAMRKRGMGIGLYYSNTDWNDIHQRFVKEHHHRDAEYTPQSDPEGFRKAIDRQTQQLRELCTNYGRIDQFGFDHGLPEELWPETVQMIKMVRQLQPEALFRHRGLGPYGDYQTPEHWVPESGDDARLQKPWQAIEHFGSRWAWQPNDTYHPREWLLHTLIDCSAKGGNFMVGVSPMANGRFDDVTTRSLLWVGRWLKVNGEAIYETRPWRHWKEREGIKFTRSKSGRNVYLIVEKVWPGHRLISQLVRAKPGSKVSLLGDDRPLMWKNTDGGLSIELPQRLQDQVGRPCEYAWVFKIEVDVPDDSSG